MQFDARHFKRTEPNVAFGGMTVPAMSYEDRRTLASLSEITIFLPRSAVAFAVGPEAFKVSPIDAVASD